MLLDLVKVTQTHNVTWGPKSVILIGVSRTNGFKFCSLWNRSYYEWSAQLTNFKIYTLLQLKRSRKITLTQYR